MALKIVEVAIRNPIVKQFGIVKSIIFLNSTGHRWISKTINIYNGSYNIPP